MPRARNVGSSPRRPRGSPRGKASESEGRRAGKRRGLLLWSAPSRKPSSLSLALSSPGEVRVQELALEDGGWHDAPSLQRKVVGKWGLLNEFL
ncbi:hypothetical protein ANAPC3_01414 [Anaplasma phagocytophilum]|nr:hypothetical protein ANAPC3_01414 [Anaplasma phagocytophilum]